MKIKDFKTYINREKFYKDQNFDRYEIHLVQLVNNVLYYKYTQVNKTRNILQQYRLILRKVLLVNLKT